MCGTQIEAEEVERVVFLHARIDVGGVRDFGVV